MESMTTSSMVLSIPELLHLVCGYSGQQTLACLAQVSASLHQISIAYLWSTRALDLWDLLKLFPGGIVEQLHAGSNEWVLKRAPEDFEWDRVQYYSVYVTKLSVFAGDGPPSMVTYLVNRSHLFFPRLRELIINASPENPSSECIRLAGQTLRTLEVQGSYLFGEESLPYNPEITGPFFRHLINHVPNLINFKIRHSPALYAPAALPPDLVDAICLLLRSSSHLQHLDWNLKHPKTILAAIAAHPSIEYLDLSQTDAWPMMGSDNLYFPSLKVAKLCCSNAAGDAFADTIGYPHLLSKLTISFSDHGYNISPHFFQSCSRLFTLSVNLTEINIGFGLCAMSWAQLRPILHCRLLVSLIIWTNNPITGLTDEDVKDLASSLLNLEALHLATRGGRISVSVLQVTLLGLIPLAQLTPHLRKLDIQVTTRVHDPSMVNALLQLQRTTSHSLHELHLGCSELNVDDDTPEFMGPRRTAGVLASMWPSLKQSDVYFGWRSSSEPAPMMKKAWEGVVRYLEQSERDGTPISFL